MLKIELYHYDPTLNNVFAGNEVLKGMHEMDLHRPANCTDVAPPRSKLSAGMVWCWHETKWVKTPDYRGQKIHNINEGSEIVIDKIGALEEGWAFGALPKSAAALKRDAKNALSADCAKTILA